MRFASLLIFLVGTSFSANASSTSIDAKLANGEIAERLLTVMTGCSDRIWPKFSWNDLSVVLIDGEAAETQTAFSVNKQQVFAKPSSDLPPAAIHTAFHFFNDSDGTRWMSINTAAILRRQTPSSHSELVMRAFKLAIHEGFHEVAQKGWTSHIDGIRGTEVPILWEPRLYRAMIYQNLREALLKPDQAHERLRNARHWYDLWSRSFPREVTSATDGYEGSARYADAIAYALSERGCSIAEDEIQGYITSVLDKQFGFSVGGHFFSLDGEGYDIGALSLFVLRQQGREAEWSKRLTAGESPLSILLEKVTASPVDAPDEKKKKFIEAGAKFEIEVEKRIGIALRRLGAEDSVFINMPGSWYSGSYSPFGFYIESASRALLIPMAMPMSFSGEGSSLKSHVNAVYLDNLGSPCGSSRGWQFVVPASSVTGDEDTRLRVSDSLFEGSLRGAFKTTSSGRQWFCAGE